MHHFLRGLHSVWNRDHPERPAKRYFLSRRKSEDLSAATSCAVNNLMAHLRRYFVPALLLLSGIFVCGKLLLTPVTMQTCVVAPLAEERGWPWVFVQRCSLKQCVESTIYETNFQKFSWLPFVADLVILLAALAGLATLVAWHSRSRALVSAFASLTVPSSCRRRSGDRIVVTCGRPVATGTATF